MQTLNEVLRGHARSRGNALALVYPQDGRSWTFAALQQQSNQAAAALAALGIGAQDRIAVLDKNVPEYVVYLYGGAKRGAVTVTVTVAVAVAVNWRLAAPEIEYVLNHSQAKVLLVGQAFAAQLAQMRLPHLRQITVVGDDTEANGATGSTDATAASGVTDTGTAAYLPFAQWIGAHAGAVDPQIPVAASDTCLQLCTSGTTGRPKGVETTHHNLFGRFAAGFNLYRMSAQSVSLAIDADGWLRTGDMAYQRDGYLFIHDRAKDMIISGGENVYPAEVENVLMQCPGIRDVAVIGVPSERWGETVKAIITAADPALREADVLAFCAARLARYKCPTSVDWVDAIPRNPSGKVLKNQLREPYWAGKTRRVG